MERKHNPDDKLALRNVLNTLFILLAIAVIVTYFVQDERSMLFYVLAFCAIFIKMVESMVRMMVNRQNKRRQ